MYAIYDRKALVFFVENPQNSVGYDGPPLVQEVEFDERAITGQPLTQDGRNPFVAPVLGVIEKRSPHLYKRFNTVDELRAAGFDLVTIAFAGCHDTWAEYLPVRPPLKSPTK